MPWSSRFARKFAESTEEKVESNNCLCHVTGLDFNVRQKFKTELVEKGQLRGNYERIWAVTEESDENVVTTPLRPHDIHLHPCSLAFVGFLIAI